MKWKWAQRLGDPTCPYMTRWVLDLLICSIRLHRFHRSDDDRHLHDHPWCFASLLVSGSYREITEAGTSGWRRMGSIIGRRASHKHRVEIRDGRDCWTFCVTGPVLRIWGFWVNKAFRSSKSYFNDFGHPPCGE